MHMDAATPKHPRNESAQRHFAKEIEPKANREDVKFLVEII
jgi:hypothetical protein